jgi:hypothetical protein
MWPDSTPSETPHPTLSTHLTVYKEVVTLPQLHIERIAARAPNWKALRNALESVVPDVDVNQDPLCSVRMQNGYNGMA